MNTDVILRLLQNSGFHIRGMDDAYLYLEDPACVLRSFETFLEYAWIVIVCITGLLLFGWAISMIRGSKNDIFTNLRNLIIMLGTVSAVAPIVNLIWGDDLFARGCDTIQIPFTELNKMLDARNLALGDSDENKLYENLTIYDSGLGGTTPYSVAPLARAGAPVDIDIGTASQPAVRAQETSNKDIIFTNPDGSQYRRTGGTRAWRNNNPGNIRYTEFARRAGAIGQAGGFAVFPNEDVGMRAIEQLLRSDSYRNLTVAGAISKYAPPTENNTAGYHRHIEELTGISVNRRISDLDDAEMARMTQAIRQIEGWGPGRIVEQ